MHELLFFIIGCLLGGIIGIFVMCLVQINHLHDWNDNGKEDNDEKQNRR